MYFPVESFLPYRKRLEQTADWKILLYSRVLSHQLLVRDSHP